MTLIDLNIGYNEFFFLVKDELKEYNGIKEAFKYSDNR